MVFIASRKRSALDELDYLSEWRKNMKEKVSEYEGIQIR